MNDADKSGNDMIAGGTGSDDIQGGAGDDYISTSSPLTAPQRLKPTDTWSPPAGEEVKVSSATWGVYIGEEAGGGKVTIWAGIGNTDTGSTEGDVVDGGAGKDDIIASWGDDRVQGGDGDDHIDGLAGDDVLEGGDGDDNISADGIIKEGYLNSVAAVNHGADFVDGGEGNDNLNGGGKDDQLFGGAGDDFLVGDSTGKTDGEYYVELQYHGEDYLDGDDDYKLTIKSIAAGARKQRAVCRFHCENGLQSTKNQPARCCLRRSNTQNAYARFAQLSEQQRVDIRATIFQGRDHA